MHDDRLTSRDLKPYAWTLLIILRKLGACRTYVRRGSAKEGRVAEALPCRSSRVMTLNRGTRQAVLCSAHTADALEEVEVLLLLLRRLLGRRTP